MIEQRKLGLDIHFPSLTADEAKGSFLFGNAGSVEELTVLMETYRLKTGQLASFLEAAGENPSLLDPYLVKPVGANRYKLGLIAGNSPLGDTSPIRAKFNPVRQDGVNFQVTNTYGDWMLCPTAEDLMMKSLKNKAVVLVNASILMKFVGKLTGLCTESFSTRKATFLEGNWYSPVDPESREAIRQAFDRGEPRVNLAEGLWIILRSVDDNSRGNAVMALSQQNAKSLPNSFPGVIRGVPRGRFRMENFEVMD